MMASGPEQKPLVWVVGAGGLLGSSLARALGTDAWLLDTTLTWGDGARLADELNGAVRQFAQRLAAEPARRWAVAWCAGAGVVGTSSASLSQETAALRQVLGCVAAEPRLRRALGLVMLTSSAGGVYGGSAASPITETTTPQPISDYGRAKLQQEAVLAEWARTQPGISTLVARLANLYGTGQRLEKPQGLISHMSRCLIFNAPVHVYVSLDTIRDYIFAEDAGLRFAAGLHRLAVESAAGQVHITKVYASEREISIAGLLGMFRQISKRRLRVVSGLNAVGALQPRRLQFRSQVWAEKPATQIELLEGIGRVYRNQMALFQQGRLRPPPLMSGRTR